MRRSAAPADFVFDGVALSGPAGDRDLLSPARFAVLRYLKGKGPRVVRVETAVTDGLDGTFAVLSGELRPRPGELWRVRGVVAGHRRRLDAGDVVDGGRCRGSRRLAPHPALRALGRPGIATAAGGAWRWRVRPEHGPLRLRCVALVRLDRRGRHRECGWTGPRQLATAVTLLGGPHHPSTVVVALSPALRRLSVTARGDRRVARARGGAAVLAYDGYLDPSLLRIEVGLRGGVRRRVRSGAAERVRVRDPLGARWTWSARTRRSRGRLCVGFQQDPPRFPAPPYFTGDATCGVQVRGARFAWAPALPSVATASRVVLYGVASPDVSALDAIVDGRARALPLAARGRAFLGVFPEALSYSRVTLVVRFRDGRVSTSRGSRTGVIAPSR